MCAVCQVKGTTFHLSEFLFGRGTNQMVKLQDPNNKLHVQIFYLAPRDYHRFHSPTDWSVSRHVYIPGCLPSVSSRTLWHTPNFGCLFLENVRETRFSVLCTVGCCFLQINRNTLISRDILDAFERTSLQGHWDPGNTGKPRLFFSMTLVAAAFVGGIELFFRKNIDSNKFVATPFCGNLKKSYSYEYKEPVSLCMGQETGTFRFGSTVVLVRRTPGQLFVNVVSSFIAQLWL